MSENERQPGELTAKQLRAIEALLAEPTTRAAAKVAGVSEATLWRLLAEPAFSQAYREARTQLMKGTLTALQAASGSAVQSLRDVLKSRTAKPSEKVSAARAILEYSLKARDVLEVEERLKALEEQINLAKSGA